MTDPITLETLSGAALLPHLDDVAKLRIAVFRDWPYLYEGDVGYERDYLAAYAQSPNSVVVLARDGDQVVGASIVQAYGGEVKVLGLVENSSTTAIVDKIRRQ